jgi:hypothetical protein
MAREWDRVHGTAPDLDRAQKRIQDAGQRGNAPQTDGAQIKLSITSGTPKTVAHKLQRKPQGYSEMSAQGDGTGSLQMTSSGKSDISFELRVPAGAPTTTINYVLWVY